MLASTDGVAVKSFHIFKDDNFSPWRLTREMLVTADAYASSGRECYHAGTRATVPFMWESQPGTPKHRLHQTPLPPLTPPPSFFSISVPTKKMTQSRKSMFPKFSFIRSRHSVRLSTSLETPPSWSSSSHSMKSSPITPLCDYYYSRRRNRFNWVIDLHNPSRIGVKRKIVRWRCRCRCRRESAMYSPQLPLARTRAAFSSGAEITELEESLLRMIHDHNQSSLKLRDFTEKAKKNAIRSAALVSELLVDKVNGEVQDAFINEKRIELELRALAETIVRFGKQTDQWLAASHAISTAVKEIGDFENWMMTMDFDCRSITAAIRNIHET
ncbi:hypothetical protein QQ045_017220 [Rhodiola kirilowii]